MTTQAGAPDAPAVYLWREEIDDDRGDVGSGFDNPGGRKLNSQMLYVRLKILNENGKQYADVSIPYSGRLFSVSDVQGRTIHSDGTTIPFTGKPFDKTVVQSNSFTVKETVFSMPDVQVGSILEYRYTLKYGDFHVLPPSWYIQRELFVREARYRFIPSNSDILTEHGTISHGVAYTEALPNGAAVKFIPSQNAYEVAVHNLPPILSDEYMPPFHSLTYRVLFYYTAAQNADDYWRTEGRFWSKEVDRFASSSKLKDVVSQIVVTGDTEQQKISKIYDAVMQLENTSFTRAHSAAENKAAGIKIKTADDIWVQKRGNNDEITLLFIGLARAAGMKAYAMMVTDRDHEIFQQNYLYLYQLDDDIAIVQIDGKEQFFDPGQRYCEFGQLHWKHTSTQGLRQTENGTAIATTPGATFKAAQTARVAQLKLDADGRLSGTIKISMSGVPALHWRQRMLETDEAATSKQFVDMLHQTLPSGVEVKVNKLTGLADWKSGLVVLLDVSGVLGSATPKRILLPASFFEAQSKPLFVHDKRDTPVYLSYASQVQDAVTIQLPAAMAVESLPKDTSVPFPNNAMYSARYISKGSTVSFGRGLIVANFLFPPASYNDLRSFYQKLNSQDQEQAVISRSAAGSGQ